MKVYEEAYLLNDSFWLHIITGK